MAKPRRPLTSSVPVEAAFHRGMIRDAALTGIPSGALYDAVNVFPHLPGKLFKRGGWSLVTDSSSFSGRSIGYLDLSTPEILFVTTGGSPGRLLKYVGGNTTLVSSSANVPRQEILTMLSGTTLVGVLPSGAGNAVPQKYVSPSTLSSLGGSPPTASLAVAYKDRLWLGGGSSAPQRIFASSLGTVDQWDTTDSWFDVEQPVTGLAALPNAMLVFAKGFSWRVTGSTPGITSDLDSQPLGNVGCTDARAITYYQGSVIVCNPEGVYMSSGGAWMSLTQRGGIDSYWHQLFNAYSMSSWVISAGTSRSFLFVTIIDGNATEVATLACHLPTLAWFRLTNIGAFCFAASAGEQSELYFVRSPSSQVGRVSPMFSPGAQNKADGNGVNVTCSIQTRLIAPAAQFQHYTDAWLMYDLRDAANDAPSLSVQIATGLSPSSFTAVPESPLAATTAPVRKRITVSKVTEAIDVKVTQTGPSASTDLFALAADVRVIEPQAENVS